MKHHPDDGKERPPGVEQIELKGEMATKEDLLAKYTSRYEKHKHDREYAEKMLRMANEQIEIATNEEEWHAKMAQALAKLDGVEVVQADANNLEQVTQALETAYGAFFVTNPFDPISCATPDAECHQAKNFATAAETVGLKHAIWSTTENPLDDMEDDSDDTSIPSPGNIGNNNDSSSSLTRRNSDSIPSIKRRTSDGGIKDYKVPHFENKAIGDRYFEEISVPTTYVLPGFFYDNFFSYFPIERDAKTGSLGFCIPTGDASIPMVSSNDIGRFVCAIFRDGPEAHKGQKLGIAAEHLTMDEVAKILSSVLNEPVANNPYVTAEMLATFGFPGCQEISNMFIYERDYSEQYRSRRSVVATMEVCADLISFAKYAEENKEPFVVPQPVTTEVVS